MIAYRKGTGEDLNEVWALFEAAKVSMQSRGIDQWDEEYPTREDLAHDIETGTLFIVSDNGETAAVYVVSEEAEDEYRECRWENRNPCMLHRFCVSPDRQDRGLGTQILDRIEQQLADRGYDSIRLDVFSQNPGALHLYEKRCYVRRCQADWRKGRFYLMEKKLPYEVETK